MTREYADSKIKDALKLCNGNLGLARQQIVAIAQEDTELLKALVKPHLDGIVAYQVERVSSGRAELEKRHPEAPPPSIEENFGMELLRAVASEGVAVFGQEGGGFPKKRKVASKEHIDAIHKLAASRRDKKTK